MKAPALFNMDAEQLQRIRQTATRVGVPISALVRYLVDVGFAERSEEHIGRWATAKRAQTAAGVRPVTPLKGSEREVLRKLTPDWLCVEKPGAVLWRALRGLEAHGLAEAQPGWEGKSKTAGRPVESYWRLVGVAS